MLKVLIVDDEKTTRETLRDCIPWQQLGIETVKTANNGKQALEMLQSEAVDILLSDVRMPKMDGIALAGEVHRLFPDCAILFLSGYSDKDYLKKAIKLQAVDYVEKPISIPEVSSAVERARDQVLNVRSTKLQLHEAFETLAQVEPLRRQALCLLLLSGRADDIRRQYSPRVYDAFCAGEIRVGLIRVDSGTGDSDNSDLCDAIVAALNKDGPEGIVAANHGRDQVCFVAGSSLAGACETFEQRVNQISADLVRLIQDRDRSLPRKTGAAPQRIVRLGLSPVLESAAGIIQGLECASTAVAGAFYQPAGRVFYYRERSNRRFEITADHLERFRQLLAVRSPFELKELAADLVGQARQTEDNDHVRVKRCFAGLLDTVLSSLPGFGSAELAAKSAQAQREALDVENIVKLSDLVQSYIDRHVAPDFHDLGVKKKVERAKNYITEAYADFELSVDDVAKKVGLSESYLCTIFKAETGSTVREFLLSVRLERAKEFLRHDNDKLHSVARRAGFKNTDYFSVVFRKETGLTPGEYRGVATV